AATAQPQRRDRDTEAERRLAALTQRVDALTASLTTLAGQLDEINGKLEALSRQPRAVAPPPATPSRPSGAAPAAPASPAPPPVGSRPTTNTLQPQDIYQAAYLDFSKGSYALAQQRLQYLVETFPQSEEAALARERLSALRPR